VTFLSGTRVTFLSVIYSACRITWFIRRLLHNSVIAVGNVRAAAVAAEANPFGPNLAPWPGLFPWKAARRLLHLRQPPSESQADVLATCPQALPASPALFRTAKSSIALAKKEITSLAGTRTALSGLSG
jgi:hypothetical protein